MKRSPEEWTNNQVDNTKSHDDLYKCIEILYDHKGHGHHYGRVALLMTPEDHSDLKCSLGLFNDLKGHVDLYGQFDPVFDP